MDGVGSAAQLAAFEEEPDEVLAVDVDELDDDDDDVEDDEEEDPFDDALSEEEEDVRLSVR